MRYGPQDHTFAICAYKESPYLQECIDSLKNQTVPTKIIIVTSTENDYIRNAARVNQLPLFIHEGPGGIANDWNFGYHSAQTRLVTIAHQDDRYHPDYTKDMLQKLNAAKDPLIYFANYDEIRDGEIVRNATMVKVKRILMTPIKAKAFQGSRFMKRRALCMGNPVACWSVAYVKKNLPETVFVSNFRSNLDWEAWEKLSRLRGEFVYSNRVLTYHRVHAGSETSNTIQSGNIRAKEDYAMFRKFWPSWLARAIMKFYIKAEKYNNT